MNARRSSVQIIGLALLLCCGIQRPGVLAQVGAPSYADAPPVPGEELPPGSEVLTRGPVHEAFAKPVTIQHETGIEISQPPPENIREMPPAEKPVGASIVWVPGYWAWDAERNDFIWLSGCWRSAPPNMHWVPGYWRAVAGGFEWVAGFWTPHMEQQQVEYFPAPPAPLEIEPPGQPPVLDHFWVPGSWYWDQGQWVLRHGYWIAPQTGWVWVPSHYAWTPRGYVFCPGYWDHDLDNRGVLFTPVYFPSVVRDRHDFIFMPNICIDLGVFRLNLFTYPRYHHYYFGDYYDDAYIRQGIYPRFDCQTVHTLYDPIFVYDHWHLGRNEPRWLEAQQHQYAALHGDRNLRPARTFTEFQSRVTRLPEAERSAPRLVASLKAHAASQSTPMKFERINTAERQKIAVQTTEAHQFREQRAHWEAPVTPASHAATGGHPPVELKPQHATVPAELKPQHVIGPVVVAHPAAAHLKEVTRAPMAPPHDVHLTQPVRVQIPSPPIVAKPAESRYIQKEPPAHPAQEHSHLPPGPNPGRPGLGRDSQKNQ